MPTVLSPIRLLSAKALRDTLREADTADNFYAAISFTDSEDLARIKAQDSDFVLNEQISDSEIYIIQQNTTSLHRILNGGVTRSVRRINWEPNGIYTPYMNNQSDSDDFYVISTEIIAGVARTNVYKCLYVADPGLTPASAPPTGIQTPPFATPDGYWWKYMYTISNSDATLFLTAEYMPVPERVIASEVPNLTVGTARYDQYVSQQNTLYGTIFYVDVDAANAPYGGTADRTIFITAQNGIDQSVQQEYVGVLIWSTAKARWTIQLFEGRYGIGYSFGTVIVNRDSDAILGPAGTTQHWLQPQISKGLGHGANPADELNGVTVMIVARNVPEDVTELFYTNNFYMSNMIRNPIDQATNLYAQQQFYNVTKSFDLTNTPSNPFQQNDKIIVDGGAIGDSEIAGRVVLTDGQRVYYLSEGPENKPFVAGQRIISPQRPNLYGVVLRSYPSNIIFGSGDWIILNKLMRPLTRSTQQTESLNFIIKY